MRNAHDILQTTKRKYFQTLFAKGYKLSPCPDAVKGSTFNFSFQQFVSPSSKMRPEGQRPWFPSVCVYACCTEVTLYTKAILLGLKNNTGMERESYSFSNIFSQELKRGKKNTQENEWKGFCELLELFHRLPKKKKIYFGGKKPDVPWTAKGAPKHCLFHPQRVKQKTSGHQWMERHVDEGEQGKGRHGEDTGSLFLLCGSCHLGPLRSQGHLPWGSGRRPPQRQRQPLRSSAGTCCGGWHRRHRGWSAHRSCPRGAPFRMGRDMGRVLPRASSGQPLQGSTSHTWLNWQLRSSMAGHSGRAFSAIH